MNKTKTIQILATLVWSGILLTLSFGSKLPSIELNAGWQTNEETSQFNTSSCITAGTLDIRPGVVAKTVNNGFPLAYESYSQCDGTSKQNAAAKYLNVFLALSVGAALGFVTSRLTILKRQK